MTPTLSVPFARRAAYAALAVVGLSCAEQLTFTAAVATSAAASSGTATLVGTVGAALSPSPGVKVLDQKGSGMPGVPVTFSIGTTAGTVAGVSVRTGPDGVATVGSWTLPTLVGTYQLAADVVLGAGVQRVPLAARANAAAPDTMLLLAGFGQAGVVGAALGTAPTVQLRDRYGNPVPGVSVTFTVAAGGGSFNGQGTASVLTDTLGIARAPSWRLGATAGAQQVTVSVPGATLKGGPVQLAATAAPASPKQITVNAGNGQQGALGTAVPVAPSVVVKDSLGNVVPGVTVNFAASAGNGVVTGGATATDAAGLATVGSWTLSGSAGPDTLVATIGVSGASVNITALAVGPAAQLAWSVPPNTTVKNGILTPNPRVWVQDAFGTVVIGATNAITMATGNNPGSGVLGGTTTRAASTGQATFNNLVISAAGVGYTLVASATGLTSATSAAFTVSAFGSLKALQFAVQPTSSATTAPIAPAVQVQLADSLGNAVLTAGQTVTVAFGANPGSATLGGTLSTTTNASGIATFSTLTVSAAGTGYTLVASAGTVTQASAAFDVRAPGAAAKLKFVVQPSATTTAGLAIAPTLQVVVQDNTGLTVPTATQTIQMALAATTAAGAVVTGVVAVNAVGGAAAFANVRVRKAGSGYRLVATATGLAPDTSTVFSVVTAPASALAWTVQPSATLAPLRRIVPPLMLDVLDSAGNKIVTSTDSVVLQSGSQTLSGRVGARAISGTVTFDSVVTGAVGPSQTILARHVPTSATANSSAFVIATGPPVRLQFIVHPPAVVAAGVTMTPVPQVAVVDSAGSVVNVSFTVTIALAANANGAVVSSAFTTSTSFNGIAAFNVVQVAKPGTGYRIVATVVGLLPDTSTAFTVTVGAPSTVAWVTQPPASLQDGVAITPVMTLNIVDTQGNLVPTATDSVALGMTLGAGQTLTGRLGARAVGGVVTFDSVVVGGVSVGRVLTARLVSNSSQLNSSFFAVVAGPPVRLRFTTQPLAVENQGVTLASLGVQSRDLAGNVVMSDTASVTVTLIGGLSGAVLGGTTLKPLVSGGASFSNLTVSRLGDLYRVVVSRAGMLPDTTVAFRIVGPAYRVKLTASPTGAIRGGGFPATIQVQDSLGFPRNAGTKAVSVALIGGTLNAVLGGTTSGNATAATGAASSPSAVTIAGLSVNLAGAGYQLVATSSGLVSDTAAAFAVAANDVAARVRFVQQPPVASATSSILTPAITVAVQDSVGNPVPGATNTVVMSINPNPGAATLGGTPTVVALAGVATFSDLTLSSAGSGYRLRASAAGLALDSSVAFNVVGAAAPCKLAFVQQPQGITAGSLMPLGVQVQVQTCAGAPVSSTAAVTLTVGVNPTGLTTGLGGGGPLAAVAGTATFNATTLTRAASGYTLIASAGGLLSATSGVFNVAAATASQLVWVDSILPSTVAGVAYPSGTVLRVGVADQYRNIVPSASNSVAIAFGAPNARSDDAWRVIPVEGPGWTGSTGSIVACNNAGGPYSLIGVSTGSAAGAVSGIATFDLSGVRVKPTGGAPVFNLATTGLSSNNLSVTPVVSSAPAVGLAFDNATVKGCRTKELANQVFLTGGQGPFGSPAVRVVDSVGNVVISASQAVTMALAAGAAGTLTGTTTRLATNGVATFNDLAVTQGGVIVLEASAPGLPVVSSPSITIAPFSTATGLRFLTQPAGGNIGVAMTPSPQVSVVDAFGNVVGNANSTNVTLALVSNPGGATLSNNGPITTASGIATFPSVALSAAGTAYTLSAAATGLTGITSSAFTMVDPNPPASLAFATQPPTTITAGNIMVPAVSINVLGSLGTLNTFATSAVTISVDSGPAGALPLQGTLTRSAVAGVVSLNDLVLRTAGAYHLRASSSGLSFAVSTTLVVGEGPASSLKFVTQPAGAIAGEVAPLFTVAVVDSYGNVIPGATNLVTICGYANVGSGGTCPPSWLSGSTTANASNGVATFAGLHIRSTVPTSLSAISSGLFNAGSASFVVQPSAPFKVSDCGAPTFGIVACAATLNPGTVQGKVPRAWTWRIVDSLDNPTTHSGDLVTLAIGTGPVGSALSGTTTVVSSAGVADFSSVAISPVGNGYSLTASATGLGTGSTVLFSVTAGAAAQLAFTVQPGATVAGQAIAPSIQIQLQDAVGNLVTNVPGTVTMSIATNPGGGTLGGTTTVALTNGVATFTGLSISNAGNGYRLGVTTTASGVTGTFTSNTFNITP